tara:strand:- start:1291 stop:1473 length:183 start_codon:yes stop_codon:yes gene_type:complete
MNKLLINGVTENGVQYYQTGENEFLCIYYFGDDYQSEITVTDIDKVKSLSVEDFIKKNDN